MKAKNFWTVIALGVILPFVFTSCEKDPIIDPDDPNNPPAVAGSEILDKGAGNVSASTLSLGTVLSYESWIKVRQTFQSGKTEDNRIPIAVKDTIKTVSDDIEVSAYDLWEYQTSMHYDCLGSQKSGYVTVYDSVLVYTVSYLSFSYNYELIYQVPVYDDGKNRVVMDYYRPTNVKSEDNASLTDKGTKEVNNIPYAVKQYNHSIKFTFAGKEYEAKAAIPLLRKLGNAGEKYITKSEVFSTNIAKLASNDGFLSSIKTEQTWSDGSKTTTDRKAQLFLEGGVVIAPEISVNGHLNNLTGPEITLTKGTVGENYVGEEYIRIYRYTDIVNITYNYFTVKIPFSYMIATYDDKVLQTDLKSYEYDVNRIDVDDVKMDFIERQGDSEYYNLQIKVKAVIGGIDVIGTYTSVVVFNS